MSGQPAPWTGPPARVKDVPVVDPEAYALGAVYRTLIGLGSTLAPRSQQRALGFSELGYACERRIAYRLAGTPVTNRRDPLASLLGTGFHSVVADTFRQLSPVTGSRFLVETPVEYRGIPGTCDLYDREARTVVDWKTSTVDRIRRTRAEGVKANYQVQVHGYAAGLAARGEDVRHVALVFVPRDGNLDELHVWRERYSQTVADTAVDRMESLRGKDPASVKHLPDNLCGWCNHHLPGSTDLSVGCPGVTP